MMSRSTVIQNKLEDEPIIRLMSMYEKLCKKIKLPNNDPDVDLNTLYFYVSCMLSICMKENNVSLKNQDAMNLHQVTKNIQNVHDLWFSFFEINKIPQPNINLDKAMRNVNFSDDEKKTWKTEVKKLQQMFLDKNSYENHRSRIHKEHEEEEDSEWHKSIHASSKETQNETSKRQSDEQEI